VVQSKLLYSPGHHLSVSDTKSSMSQRAHARLQTNGGWLLSLLVLCCVHKLGRWSFACQFRWRKFFVALFWPRRFFWNSKAPAEGGSVLSDFFLTVKSTDIVCSGNKKLQRSTLRTEFFGNTMRYAAARFDLVKTVQTKVSRRGFRPPLRLFFLLQPRLAPT